MKMVTEVRKERTPVTRLKQVPYIVTRYTPRLVPTVYGSTSYVVPSDSSTIVGPVVERKAETPSPTRVQKPEARDTEKSPGKSSLEPIPALELEQLDAPRLELKRPENDATRNVRGDQTA
jgi:hypothetical protein